MNDQKKSIRISFVTTPNIQEALQKASENQDRSISWLIGKALEEYLMEEGHLKKQRSSDR